MLWQLSLQGVVSGHLQCSHDICHYYWPVALFPHKFFIISVIVGGLEDSQTVAFSFHALIHHIRCWGLWSGPTDILLGKGPPLPATTWTRQFQHVSEPPSFLPPPVALQPTLLWVTIGSLRLRRDGPVVRGQISTTFPRGRRWTNSRQCFLASVLVTPCTALTLIRPKNKPSGAPSLLSSFFLPTPGTRDDRGPTETHVRKL